MSTLEKVISEMPTDIDFDIMMAFATEMISQLKIQYPTSSIDNWKGYLVQRLSYMLPSYQTFNQVLLQDNDYITANTILRMMADNLAITKFIYVDHEGDMRLLRHYMFLLDGSLTYIQITDSMECFNKQIIEEREKCKEEAQYIQGQITNLSLYKDNCDALEKLIKIDKRSCKWNFRNFSDKEKFHFHELYNNMNLKPDVIAYLRYLSQFAHGLGLYSLGTVANIQNIQLLLEIRDLLLGLLISNVFPLFSAEMDNITITESLRKQLKRTLMEDF